jgi:hypothetical protein
MTSPGRAGRSSDAGAGSCDAGVFEWVAAAADSTACAGSPLVECGVEPFAELAALTDGEDEPFPELPASAARGVEPFAELASPAGCRGDA